MTLKVGDIVTVKRGLIDMQEYDGCSFVSHMEQYMGEKLKIERIFLMEKGTRYKCATLKGKGINWNWSAPMFETGRIKNWRQIVEG